MFSGIFYLMTEGVCVNYSDAANRLWEAVCAES